MRRYHDHVMQRFDTGLSAAYVKSRFVKVRAILNYGIRYTEDREDCRRALDLCAVLVPPEQEVNPRPIDPADFGKLLEAPPTTTARHPAARPERGHAQRRGCGNARRRHRPRYARTRRTPHEDPRPARGAPVGPDGRGDPRLPAGRAERRYLFVSRTGRASPANAYGSVSSRCGNRPACRSR